MASTGYPHMVFVQPDAGLDKESLAVFLSGLFPDAEVTDKPLRVDVAMGGYVFSLWLEEAEGVADRYATYLPEGARRRWLSRCESMIDLHGQPDPDRVHAAQAERIVSALQAQEGIEVFSEESRRFVGMDYGDGTSGAVAVEPAPAYVEPVAAAPEPVVVAPEAWAAAAELGTSVASPYEGQLPQPAAEPDVQPDAPATPQPAPETAPAAPPTPAHAEEPSTVWMPVAPEPVWSDAPAALAEQAAAGHDVAPESPEPAPYDVPAGAPPADAPDAPGALAADAPGAPAASAGAASEEEKQGFFKRVFGRRNA